MEGKVGWKSMLLVRKLLRWSWILAWRLVKVNVGVADRRVNTVPPSQVWYSCAGAGVVQPCSGGCTTMCVEGVVLP